MSSPFRGLITIKTSVVKVNLIKFSVAHACLPQML